MTKEPDSVPGTLALTLQFDSRDAATQALYRHTALGGVDPAGHTIAMTNRYLEIDGQPALPVMGEFHYSRFPQCYWAEEMLKIRAGGVDILSTYVFWIHHEEDEGHFDWTGDRDLRAFVQLCGQHKIPVIVRIGPFAHGECRNGGLPDWLYGQPFAVRSTDERFLWYVRRLYTQINTQLAGLLYKDGGPVIGVQLDNEYMHCGAPWEVTYRPGNEWVPSGHEGTAYMQALKDLAREAGLDVPLYTCTGWIGSPVLADELLPMQGGYAFTPWIPDPEYQQPPSREFLFRDRRQNPVTGGLPTYDSTRYPLACCELGGGIQITYAHRPIVPPECVEAMAVVALGSGANLLGYYMYHGGTQPVGQHGYLNEGTVPRRSYDFQAPIREFGQLGASFHALKLIHLFLHAFGSQLAPMDVTLPVGAEAIVPDDTTTIRLAGRAKDGKGFLFLTNYQDHVATIDHHNVTLSVAADGKEIVIGRDGTLALLKDSSAILPINLSLGPHRLVYATTQPLTCLATDAGALYVFFAVPGMAPEYVFETATVTDISVSQGSMIEDGDLVRVMVSPGMGSIITLTAGHGQSVRVLTLTRAEALQCWRVALHGQEHLTVSDATILAQDDLIKLSSTGKPTASLSIFPPLPGGLYTTTEHITGNSDGQFTTYSVAWPPRDIDVHVSSIGDHRYLVQLTREHLSEEQDIFLHIDYVGDMAEAYIDGLLVADNFGNGTIWEIGLKRFAGRLARSDLLIKIVPLPQEGRAKQYLPTGMAAQLAKSGGQIARINRITAVPQYSMTLRAGIA